MRVKRSANSSGEHMCFSNSQSTDARCVVITSKSAFWSLRSLKLFFSKWAGGGWIEAERSCWNLIQTELWSEREVYVEVTLSTRSVELERTISSMLSFLVGHWTNWERRFLDMNCNSSLADLLQPLVGVVPTWKSDQDMLGKLKSPRSRSL